MYRDPINTIILDIVHSLDNFSEVNNFDLSKQPKYNQITVGEKRFSSVRVSISSVRIFPRISQGGTLQGKPLSAPPPLVLQIHFSFPQIFFFLSFSRIKLTPPLSLKRRLCRTSPPPTRYPFASPRHHRLTLYRLVVCRLTSIVPGSISPAAANSPSSLSQPLLVLYLILPSTTLTAAPPSPSCLDLVLEFVISLFVCFSLTFFADFIRFLSLLIDFVTVAYCISQSVIHCSPWQREVDGFVGVFFPALKACRGSRFSPWSGVQCSWQCRLVDGYPSCDDRAGEQSFWITYPWWFSYDFSFLLFGNPQ